MRTNSWARAIRGDRFDHLPRWTESPGECGGRAGWIEWPGFEWREEMCTKPEIPRRVMREGAPMYPPLRETVAFATQIRLALCSLQRVHRDQSPPGS